MTVNAVRLNHAVLFVADLERSIAFYQQAFDMTVMAREPRANAAFLRLPRSGQPPRPRPVRGRRPAAAAPRRRSGCTTWPGRSTPSRSSRRPGSPWRTSTPHRRVQPRRHQERLRPRPRRQRVRGDVDAAQGQLGRVRERRPGRAPRPARRGTPLGRRPHRRRAGPGGRVDDRRRRSRRPSSRRTAPPTRPRRWSCCCTAAARTSARSSAWPRTCRPGRRTPRCGRRSPRAAGFAWFANRGIGRPVADSLRSTMDWFRGWLDEVAPAGPAGAAGRLQRRRRLRRRPGARRPGAVRRRRDPLRHAALRRRCRRRPRPAGRPARLRRPGRGRPRHPARAARPDLGLPASPSPARPRSRSATPAGTSSPRRRCASSGTGSPSSSDVAQRGSRSRALASSVASASAMSGCWALPRRIPVRMCRDGVGSPRSGTRTIG